MRMAREPCLRPAIVPKGSVTKLPMRSFPKRLMPWLLAWLAITLASGLVLARSELSVLREAFETDARIAHRLLSQRMVQHDAVLATLV